MSDSVYSWTELNGIYFTFKFHHTFCQLVTRYFEREKNSWQALTVSMLFVLKSFMKNRFTTKSSEAICDLFRAQARPYKSTGTHLLLINCNTTSSEAILPTLPKMLFFKAELFIIDTNKFAKFFNKAIFENFRYHGADSYAPKIFT